MANEAALFIGNAGNPFLAAADDAFVDLQADAAEFQEVRHRDEGGGIGILAVMNRLKGPDKPRISFRRFVFLDQAARHLDQKGFAYATIKRIRLEIALQRRGFLERQGAGAGFRDGEFGIGKQGGCRKFFAFCLYKGM